MIRTTEQAEGGKVVGVDPTTITAGECSHFLSHAGHWKKETTLNSDSKRA